MVKQQKKKKDKQEQKIMGNGDTEDSRMTDRQWTINRQTVIWQVIYKQWIKDRQMTDERQTNDWSKTNEGDTKDRQGKTNKDEWRTKICQTSDKQQKDE